MKKTVTTNSNAIAKINARQNSLKTFSVTKTMLLAAALLLLTITSCEKSNDQPADPDQAAYNEWLAKVQADTSLKPATINELKDARIASTRYRSLDSAKKDGYDDINVVRANMGYHFLRAGILDTVFDAKKPEILVYNKETNGKFTLVAVEYAVPINLRPLSPPPGFTGNTDVWKFDTEFGLWLLHAWVWSYNPTGVFKPTNPDVHVHQ